MSQQPKIGLALGSGGARGYAHLGVLRVLESEGIPIDYMAGSSMGALVAALYGAGHSVQNLIQFTKKFKRKYYIDFTVPKMGFVAGKRVKELIRALGKGKSIDELRPPVAIVATDLLKGERVIFREGDLATAVRASIAIPGVFVPEKWNGRLLVDGGVIDRVPVSVVKEMGADLTIAVDVSFFREEPIITTIYDVMIQSMDIMARELIRNQEIDCSVMIRPIVEQSKTLDFVAVERLIEQGEEAAYQKIDMIKHEIQRWKETHHGD
ncbi:patatin-like phospholipase family protein [Halalkalibacterium ligniniphilum]|uniref:patatin-like phospholipase family protein n=1 Tax=Halalkalibacterium ligniniphilum TaxID=1134413 RepID=UPI00034DBAC7|nr:patatin-like phospholipase family protein [Halalkalibacterium ligniniphilum]